MLRSQVSWGKGLRPRRTSLDDKLMKRSGLDEVSLRRARKAFQERWRRTPLPERRRLAEASIVDRFGFVIDTLRSTWSPEAWNLWLRFLEHTDAEIDEMVQGEYPISPYMVRVSSALLGVTVDFLAAGGWPAGDYDGPDIDVLPPCHSHRA